MKSEPRLPNCTCLINRDTHRENCEFGPRPLMTSNAGPPEAEVLNVGVLWEFLWSLLDDIDTAGDIFKDDNVGYRKYVEAKQRRRWESGVTSDGYTLTAPPTR